MKPNTSHNDSILKTNLGSWFNHSKPAAVITKRWHNQNTSSRRCISLTINQKRTDRALLQGFHRPCSNDGWQAVQSRFITYFLMACACSHFISMSLGVSYETAEEASNGDLTPVAVRRTAERLSTRLSLVIHTEITAELCTFQLILTTIWGLFVDLYQFLMWG